MDETKERMKDPWKEFPSAEMTVDHLAVHSGKLTGM
jgi:hypothetical protein